MYVEANKIREVRQWSLRLSAVITKSPSHYLFDLIYNPAETLFLQYGAQRGAHTCNGLDMLVGQAEAAWAIWNR